MLDDLFLHSSWVHSLLVGLLRHRLETVGGGLLEASGDLASLGVSARLAVRFAEKVLRFNAWDISRVTCQMSATSVELTWDLRSSFPLNLHRGLFRFLRLEARIARHFRS